MAALTITRRSQATTWRAMGTRAHVAVVGGDEGDLIDARAAIDDRERRWSRFQPTSEISAINSHPGRAVLVQPDTARLVDDAVAWWKATEGRFDPTVLRAVLDAGYLRSFADGPGPIRDGSPAPGCAGVHVDPIVGAVRVPAGVGLDLGGIGKGTAVDHAVTLLAERVAGGLVDLGGDLRVWGEPLEGEGWPIAVEDVRHGRPAALLWLAAGAVTTSTSLRRCWTDGVRTAHHLIDPSTGRPVDGDVVSVTVVAAQAQGAEVLAKAALVTGTIAGAVELLEQHGVAGLVTPRAGDAVTAGAFAALCHPAEAQ